MPAGVNPKSTSPKMVVKIEILGCQTAQKCVLITALCLLNNLETINAPHGAERRAEYNIPN
jgi:hypothetical protein